MYFGDQLPMKHLIQSCLIFLLFVLSFYFFNCELADLGSTLGHYREDKCYSPDVTHFVIQLRPEGHRAPRSKVEKLNPAERLVEFEPVTF